MRGAIRCTAIGVSYLVILSFGAELARAAEGARTQREQDILEARYKEAETLSAFGGCRTASPAGRRPRIIRKSDVEYPSPARAAGQTGTVVVCIEISAQGGIARMGVIQSSLFPLLDEAAMKSIATWTFAAAVDERGTAMRDVLRVPVDFDLE